MADNIMFKIGNTDLSSKVVSEGYAVQSEPQYKAWTDANGSEHRSVYRQQISGTFTMYFPEIADFDSFNTLLQTHIENDTSVQCMLWVNNQNSSVLSNYFIECDASRYRDAKWADMVGKVKVSIKER